MRRVRSRFCFSTARFRIRLLGSAQSLTGSQNISTDMSTAQPA